MTRGKVFSLVLLSVAMFMVFAPSADAIKNCAECTDHDDCFEVCWTPRGYRVCADYACEGWPGFTAFSPVSDPSLDQGEELETNLEAALDTEQVEVVTDTCIGNEA